VLDDVVLEIGQGGVGASHQHFLVDRNRIADFGEEFVDGPHIAVVLTRRVMVRLELAREGGVTSKLVDRRGLMIEPDDGVSVGHDFLPTQRGETLRP
jgi:hypothetical protein